MILVRVVRVTSRPRLLSRLPPGLVREQEAGLLQFLRLDGFSVLMRAMQQQVQKLKVKSAFLLQNLLVGHPEHKGGAARAGGPGMIPKGGRGEGNAWERGVDGPSDPQDPSPRDPVLHGDGPAAGGPDPDRTQPLP